MLPLQEIIRGTLNNAGNAEVLVSPKGAWVRWEIVGIILQGNSNQEPTLEIQLNKMFLCGSGSANDDTASSPTPILVNPGDQLVFLWTGGTPGAIMGARLLGNVRDAVR